MPKVSVILPNYNHARYLPARLASIAQQSYRDFELILLDDASSDGSQDILEAFAEKHPHCRTHFNAENSGSPFVQWNRGVEMARGEYLWIAESDDLAHPDFLQRLVPLMEENTDLGIAYVQSMLIDEEGREMHSYEKNLRFIYQSDAWQENFIKVGKEACRDWLLKHNPIPNASGILMRKSAYLAVGGADEGMRLNGDWHLYSKILLRYDLGFIAKELNYFRQHTASQREKSIKNASVYQELIAINQLIAQALPEAKEEVAASLDEFGNWWIGNLPYHRRSRENWRINKALFKFFRPIKKPLVWRILLTFIISYLRDFLKFMGWLPRLKKWRKQLFPGKYWSE